MERFDFNGVGVRALCEVLKEKGLADASLIFRSLPETLRGIC